MLFTSETCTSAAGACNEDICGVVDNAAWILDGATSLSRRTILKANGKRVSDAAYFVSILSSYFLQHISVEQDIASALQCSLEQARGDEHIRRYLADDVDIPSASFAAVKWSGHRVQVMNLGDCTILLQADGGAITPFGSSAVRELDAQLLSSYQKLRARLRDPAAVWDALVPLIREGRARMNKPGGYWILEPSGAGLRGLQEFELGFRTRLRGLLVTDGLYRIVDTYRLLTQDDFFAEAFEVSGLERLVTKTRAAEAFDVDERHWPRVKARDDATIVRFEIQ